MTYVIGLTAFAASLFLSACTPVAEPSQARLMIAEISPSRPAPVQPTNYVCTASGAGMAGTCVNR